MVHLPSMPKNATLLDVFKMFPETKAVAGVSRSAAEGPIAVY